MVERSRIAGVRGRSRPGANQALLGGIGLAGGVKWPSAGEMVADVGESSGGPSGS